MVQIKSFGHRVWRVRHYRLHIDSLARFVAPEHVVANLPAQLDTYDRFHSAAVETIAPLLDRGVIVDVIEEPTKPRLRDLDFVASYVNH